MATNFSPCKGSYVLNQFPRNVMFGMNGFHVSASGAIQGHHGPLVVSCQKFKCCLMFSQADVKTNGKKCTNIQLVSRYILELILFVPS